MRLNAVPPLSSQDTSAIPAGPKGLARFPNGPGSSARPDWDQSADAGLTVTQDGNACSMGNPSRKRKRIMNGELMRFFKRGACFFSCLGLSKQDMVFCSKLHGGSSFWMLLDFVFAGYGNHHLV